MERSSKGDFLVSVCGSATALKATPIKNIFRHFFMTIFSYEKHVNNHGAT